MFVKSLNGQVIIGILLGILFGMFIPSLALEQQVIGNVFVSLLKMIVVPLVFASIFIAIAGLGSLERLKNIGLKTLGLYLLTTALSVLLAIAVMNIINIGEATSSAGLVFEKAKTVQDVTFSSMILSFIPTNIFNSLASGAMMQIIIFSVLLSITSLYLPDEEKSLLLSFFTAISNAMLVMANWVIKLTPIGVFSLISYIVAKQGIDTILNLWEYVLLVLGVLAIHGMVSLPIVLKVFGRINPYEYLGKVKEVSLMAFSTASSAATLPVSIKVSQEEGGVSARSAGFVLPLGATVSMDGTAAYLTIAVLYIANLSGVVMTFGDQLLLGITVVALSVGVAALPSASLVMMVVILNQLGLPVEYLAVIVAVDRILDMARTSLNVTSDLVVTKIIDERTSPQNVL
ncbi:MAG: dicarboxylate/amino acid:cation symporter [Campylobacteraceae bacterium]|jgi:Na+/H+-dicarboxylate symporter|nr:dicarboxylate/amino acid:cation symporter [Campylobacteraceae bacterium]MBT4572506.1 dicarboxylate/amino acid:cation symporter [Campylobacteraceae bacterium]MBT4708381.1 dicarboxylate/amino acid:cation symporter [Campylobacteraceae bacterium]MBT5323301.1 dicarboxylate/amino acid:cation symporter [Campylobacteraceae bacterium]MBT5982357.1 dicarboxylate/amino acid:cation symporter [Campylobacteraceae bacterium]